jgi:hypothetical protein
MIGEPKLEAPESPKAASSVFEQETREKLVAAEKLLQEAERGLEGINIEDNSPILEKVDALREKNKTIEAMLREKKQLLYQNLITAVITHNRSSDQPIKYSLHSTYAYQASCVGIEDRGVHVKYGDCYTSPNDKNYFKTHEDIADDPYWERLCQVLLADLKRQINDTVTTTPNRIHEKLKSLNDLAVKLQEITSSAEQGTTDTGTKSSI